MRHPPLQRAAWAAKMDGPDIERNGMTKPSILVTGGKFVTPNNVRRMRDAGYSVTRINRVPDSQGWLRDALRGRVGYVWGGMEHVTLDSIDLADRLQAIAFPGSGYTEFIPAWRELTERGVAISTSVGLNAPSVAEYAVSLMLSMLRVQPATAPTADPIDVAEASHELSGVTVGVIGFGHIGRRVAEISSTLGMNVLATGRSALQRSPPGVEPVALDELVRRADVITLHVDRLHGEGVLSAQLLRKTKRGALILNVAFPEAVDLDALRARLVSGRLRAAFDGPPVPAWTEFPSDRFIASMRGQTAFDTVEANRRIGDRVTESILNLLGQREDPGIVNPDFRQHRSK